MSRRSLPLNAIDAFLVTAAALEYLRDARGAWSLEIPAPGRHNLENGAAAALIALELGLSPATVTALLARFPGVDIILGPEMRSTGEVMGWDRNFPRAFLKAQLGAGTVLPSSGQVFISIKDSDKTAEMAAAAAEIGGYLADYQALIGSARGVPQA